MVEYQNIEELNKKEILYSILIIIIVVFSFIFFVAGPTETKVAEEVRPSKSTATFENLELEARAVFVWDIANQKEIYSEKPEAQLYLASLSKVMMAVTAFEELSPGMSVMVSSKNLSEEGDSGLFVGEEWALKDLIDFSLVVSSNDGASAIASAIIGSEISEKDNQNEFVGLMNRKAREIGMPQTYFLSPSGLDKNDLIPGGSGSARDMAILFEYALTKHPSILEATGYPISYFNSLSDISHEAENTNELVSKLPGIIASKTGFTEMAGGNLAIAFEPEPSRPIILIVLGSTLEGRFEDMEKLYLTTLNWIN